MKRTRAAELSEEQKLAESVRYLKRSFKTIPRIGIVLGSGLGDFAQSFTRAKSVDTSTIPHYPLSTVVGHSGRITSGYVEKTPVLAFQGRLHLYECGHLPTVLYPINVAHQLGVKILIITNAAGGVNHNFRQGDLMLIRDHINLTFENPLHGIEIKKRRKRVYDERLLQIARSAAGHNSIAIQEGIYCGMKGPCYETAAEVRMVERIGADATGMSTVNEATLAAAYGMRLLGISCITNLATGISPIKLTHEEVTAVANQVNGTFTSLLRAVIGEIPASSATQARKK